MEIGPGLAPMQPLREELVFLKGLFNEQAANHKSVHLGRIPNLLSGAWVSTDQNEIRAGRSMDQVLADSVGKSTPVPSLALGIERLVGLLLLALALLAGLRLGGARSRGGARGLTLFAAVRGAGPLLLRKFANFRGLATAGFAKNRNVVSILLSVEGPFAW